MKKYFKVMFLLTIPLMLAFALSGCGSSGSSSSSSPASSSTYTVTPAGGGAITGATVNLLANGSTYSCAETASPGTYSCTVSPALPSNAPIPMEITVSGGSINGAASSSDVVLVALANSDTPTATSIPVNELTTAVAITTSELSGYAINPSTGAITIPSSDNSTILSKIDTLESEMNFNNGNITASSSPSVLSYQVTALDTVANDMATCVDNSGDCSGLMTASGASSTPTTVNVVINLYLNNKITSTNPFTFTPSTNEFEPSSGSSSALAGSISYPLSYIPYNTVETGTYAVGTNPLGIAIDSSGDAWVTNTGNGDITELSPTGATIGTYAVGTNPLNPSIDSAGNIWVPNNGSGTVTELSPKGATIGTYSTGGTGPMGTAIDSAGNIWVTNNGSNNVTELSPKGSIIGIYQVGVSPCGITIDSSGDAWVANVGSDTVTELSPTGATIGTYAVGKGPHGIAANSSGDIWVANMGSDSVTELSPTGATIGTYAVGTSPDNIALDTYGDVWVTNTGSGNVTELSPTGATTTGIYNVGTSPHGIAIDKTGDVWVANNGSNNVTELFGVCCPV